MVTILAAQSPKLLKLFEQIPELIHPDQKHLVPPYPGSIAKIFGARSAFLRKGKLFPFIAFRNEKPVGRIAAIINQAHNEYYQDQTGFFGFFDFIPDLEVARTLLKKASQILETQNCKTMRGPYNPSVNDECGLLVEGFDSSPMVMMPYNPDYYESIYQELGLEVVRSLYAYYLRSDMSVPDKINRVVERVRKKSGISFRNIDLKNMDQELAIIRDLYNHTLKRNWGFVPISKEELEFAAEDLKQIIQPELVLIAEKAGEPVGFSMLLPNINEHLLYAKSSKGLLRILKFIWRLKTQSPKEARLAILGVKPEYENIGVPAVFYLESIQRGKKAFQGGELSWIEQSNTPMIRSLEMMGAKKTKTYQIFEKVL